MNPERETMLRKADDSLRAARLLIADGLNGFAASRAYYAMFYAAEALLEAHNMSFSKHSAVIAAIGRHFASRGLLSADFHRYLIDAQDARHLGDYDFGPEIPADEAQKHLARAEEFVEAVRALLDRPSYPSMTP